MSTVTSGRRLLQWGIAVAWIALLWRLTVRLADRALLPMYDFLEYWSASHLQLTGHNPYSPEELLALQKSIGWPWDGPLMMWNPPWTLVFVMPFGLLSFEMSRVLWLWVSLGLLLVCTDWAWRFYGGLSQHRWLARLVSFAFLPTLLVLYLGQVGPLILAGVVGFLYFEKRRRWWQAGAATVLIALKPQLLYLFWLALLLWALHHRRWSVLLGGGLAGLLAMGVAMIFNPAVVSQYIHTTASEPPLYWETPTLGTALRLLFGQDRHWLQFVPTGLGALWFAIHWRRHRHKWIWAEQMPLVLLVSLLTTPHRWTHDQVVLLPALMQAAVWVVDSRQRSIAAFAVVGYLAINTIPLTPVTLPGDFWRIWMTPALLAGYLLLRRQIPPLPDISSSAAKPGPDALPTIT